MSPQLQDLVSRLLERDERVRLGSVGDELGGGTAAAAVSERRASAPRR